MSTLLTTGQLIDTLKVGQVAERIFEPNGDCSDAYTKAKLGEDGNLMFYVDHWGEWSCERMTRFVINSKWFIK